MSSLKLYGSTSGYVEIVPEATAGNNSVTLPNGSGTLVAADGSGNLNVSGIITASSAVVGSAVTITSGGVLAGVVTATSFVGDGSGLTSLDAGDISAGTLAIARGGTNSTATATAGGAAYGTGSAFAFTSAGSSGQVLTSNGTSAPTWQDAGGGAWNFISSVTASGSGSVTFTSGINSTYGIYVVTYSNVIHNLDNGLTLAARISSDGGSTYNSNADYDYYLQGWGSQTGNATQLEFNYVRRSVDNTAASGFFYLYKPNVSYRQVFSWHGVNPISGVTNVGSGRMRSATTINAIQFFITSTSITTGTFSLYGLSNS